MKKIIITMMSLFMIMSFSTMAIAVESSQEKAGTPVLIGTAGVLGGVLSYSPSPSTLMSVFTSPIQFTATSASSKTTGLSTAPNSPTGIEYGIDSDLTAVYQKIQAVTGSVTATTSAVTLPTPTDFKDKNGVSATAS